MESRKENIGKALQKYVPSTYVSYIIDLMFSEKLSFKITKPRKTKLGDYRPPFNGKPHRITINGDLNPYAFLITTLHEFAHLRTNIHYGNKVKPHGKEWKREFKQLLLPVLSSPTFPEKLKNALLKSLNNLAASTCTNLELSRALKEFDSNRDKVVFLESIPEDALFLLGKKTFRRGLLQRKRYLCTDVHTGKKYFVNCLAEVEPIN